LIIKTNEIASLYPKGYADRFIYLLLLFFADFISAILGF